jgi:DUF1680 family protein
MTDARTAAPQAPEQEAGARRSVVVDTSASPHARLRPVAMDQVEMQDGFWEPWRSRNRRSSVLGQHAQLEASGVLDNFRRAAGTSDAPYRGPFFADSDAYKWLEAASWELAAAPDAEIERHVDAVIAVVAAAQEPDGYLDTYFTFEHAGERWSDLPVKHELYVAGHLIQAAVAHHRATGKTSLLDVAVRLADCIDGVFGPAGRPGADGHPEVEMALVELARDTGERRYVDLAAWFVDQHGQDPPTISGRRYHLDHAPFREQAEVTGHAVRALYLYSGATDVYLETGDETLWPALEALWHNLQQRRVYVTGGAGARWDLESFGEDYELPNEVAYTETCAGVAHVQWAWRMLLATGEGRFRDAIETTLYNAVLPGVSLAGDAYYYQNPLADRGGHRRSGWFSCACCPPNLARTLGSLPCLLYATDADGLWVNQYAASRVRVPVGDGTLIVRQETGYPWSGDVAVVVEEAPASELTLRLAVPAWADGATLQVSGDGQPVEVPAGAYAQVRRTFRPGDTVHLSLPLEPRLVQAHRRVAADVGRLALLRGPLVYCLETADQGGEDAWDLRVDPSATWQEAERPDLLGGCITLQADGHVLRDEDDPDVLYRRADRVREHLEPARLTAIPYHLWANREPGAMQVWMPVSGEASG